MYEKSWKVAVLAGHELMEFLTDGCEFFKETFLEFLKFC